MRTSKLPVSAQMWRQVRPCESVAFATDPFKMQSSTRSTPACFALQASMSIKFCLQNLPFFCSACSAPFIIRFMGFPHMSLTLIDASTHDDEITVESRCTQQDKKNLQGGDQIYYYGVSGFKSRVLRDVARKSRVLQDVARKNHQKWTSQNRRGADFKITVAISSLEKRFFDRCHY